jgi:hypothetical protein
MEPRDKALTPPIELPISEFHACINAIQQYKHQSHDWEQTRVQSPVLAKVFSWDFSRFKYSQTCVQRPPLEPEKCGRYTEVCLKKISGKEASDWLLWLQTGQC